jgi:hypothetical protein
MFRRFAGKIPDGAEGLFKCHPIELTALLEMAWRSRLEDQTSTSPELGKPAHRSNLKAIPDFWLEPSRISAGIEPPSGQDGQPSASNTSLKDSFGPFDPGNPNSGLRSVLWDHLIYAYMIENTRIYEIFRRVLYEFLNGEKLGIPTDDTQHWLRNTEELFYRDPAPFSITTITSNIRPDMAANRRNAYQRMFGMDLNHGTDENKPYPYIRADAANNEFVPTFEELLREVWVGITNFNNNIGSDPTDDSKIAVLATKLHDMLISRRKYGNLSREEFVFVSMMSWFHLTVAFDSPLVKDLKAEATSPEQRLFKIAQRVGLPAHGLSKSYFEIADPISRVLILIETGDANTTNGARAFYHPDALQSTMRTIITHWSTITGREMKAGKVATS